MIQVSYFFFAGQDDKTDEKFQISVNDNSMRRSLYIDRQKNSLKNSAEQADKFTFQFWFSQYWHIETWILNYREQEALKDILLDDTEIWQPPNFLVFYPESSYSTEIKRVFPDFRHHHILAYVV